MQNSWRKSVRMRYQPALQHLFHLGKRLAHRSLSVGRRMNPDGITDGYLDPRARAIRDSLVTALHLQRIISDLRDRHHVACRERTGEAGRHGASITND